MRGDRATITTRDGGVTVLIARRSGGRLETDWNDRSGILTVEERNGGRSMVNGKPGDILRSARVAITEVRSLVTDTVTDGADDAALTRRTKRSKGAAA